MLLRTFVAATLVLFVGAVASLSLGTEPGLVRALLATGPAFGVIAAHRYANGLEHPTRRRIYDHLVLVPGDHFRSIARTMHLGIGTLKHHLDVLSLQGWVAPKRMNGRVRYYAKGPEARPEMNELYDKHWMYRDLKFRILAAVKRLGEARPVIIAHALSISRQLATYHLAQLAEAGVLRKDRGRYTVTADLPAGQDRLNPHQSEGF